MVQWCWKKKHDEKCYFQHLSFALADFTSWSRSSLSSSMLSCNILRQPYMKWYCIAYDFKSWCLQPTLGTTSSSAGVTCSSAAQVYSPMFNHLPAVPLLLFCFSRGTFCLGWQLPQKADVELHPEFMQHERLLNILWLMTVICDLSVTASLL